MIIIVICIIIIIIIINIIIIIIRSCRLRSMSRNSEVSTSGCDLSVHSPLASACGD